MARLKGKRRAKPAEEDIIIGEESMTYGFAGESFAKSIEGKDPLLSIASNIDNPLRLQNSTCSPGVNGLYENLANAPTPFAVLQGTYIDPSIYIELCQKAYFYVSIFRNTIDMLSEFANTPIKFVGGNEKSRTFFEKWWTEKINGYDLCDQYYREWFRSGNVFYFRLDSNITVDTMKEMRQVYGATSLAKDMKLPVKYVLLNPAYIRAQGLLNFNKGTYFQVLTTFQVARLKNPITQEDQDYFNSLPDEAKKLIKAGGYPMIPLDPKKVYTIFAKKQDYEPFAAPMFYPVLSDIDLKLQFKKMEKIISRTVEYVILLINVGTEERPNPKAMQGVKELFRNETIGRVLVADGTTQMKFVVPDINKILGKEKYAQVNEDINQGLQNFIFDDAKFSSTSIKTRAMMERLKAARTAFLTYFLNPEIKRISEDLGFKTYPVAECTEIDLQDKAVMAKVYTRLIELNILTPQEGLEAIKTGYTPNTDESLEAQKAFKPLRDKGYYYPLVGGSQQEDGGRPVGKGGTRSSSPAGTTKASFGHTFSLEKIKDIMIAANDFQNDFEDAVKKHYKVKKLSKKQKEVSDAVAELVMANEKPENWGKNITKYLKSPEPTKECIASVIDEIMVEHETSRFLSTVLYHAKIEQNNPTKELA